MAAYVPPRRAVSSPTQVKVVSSTLPAWQPAPGKFTNILRSDTGTIHVADQINPDVFNPDGSFHPYRGIFSDDTFGFPSTSGTGGAFINVWRQQNGGDLNMELGALGSMILYGGGHITWNGTHITRFDIATGKWSAEWQDGVPIFTSLDRSIVGGTVALGTGTVSNTNSLDTSSPTVNDRLARDGNYIKTADGVAIPGAGTAFPPFDATVWNGYPVHTNNGICILPSEAGGGPNGSMLYWTHGQTGAPVGGSDWSVFRFDFATRKWSKWAVGDRITSSRPEPTLMYDKNRKVIWARGGSGRPQILDYNTGIRYWPQGPTANVSQGYIPGFIHMPQRDLVVFILASNYGTNIDGNFTGPPWAERDNADWLDNASGAKVPPHTPNSTLQGIGAYFFPRIQAYSIAGCTIGPTGNANSFNSTIQDLIIAPKTWQEVRDALDAGIDTGWPGFRSTANGNLRPGEENWKGANDNSTIMAGGCWGWQGSKDNGQVRGVNDGLMYGLDPNGNEFLFCIERNAGPENGTPTYDRNRVDDINPGTLSDNSRIKFWKLTPPPIGQNQFTQPWTWTRELIQQQSPTIGGFACGNLNNLCNLGGKARYHPTLKSIILTENNYMPVQAIRSINWT